VSGIETRASGERIVGFGSYRYLISSGREHQAPVIAFSARASSFSLCHIDLDAPAPLLGWLGQYKTGKRCMYIARLIDVDVAVLEELCAHSFARVRATTHGSWSGRGGSGRRPLPGGVALGPQLSV